MRANTFHSSQSPGTGLYRFMFSRNFDRKRYLNYNNEARGEIILSTRSLCDRCLKPASSSRTLRVHNARWRKRFCDHCSSSWAFVRQEFSFPSCNFIPRVTTPIKSNRRVRYTMVSWLIVSCIFWRAFQPQDLSKFSLDPLCLPAVLELESFIKKYRRKNIIKFSTLSQRSSFKFDNIVL